MSTLDAGLAFLGAYVAVGLLAASWRRAAESRGDTGLWIACCGYWLVAVWPRWIETAPESAPVAALVWMGLAFLLARAGALLGRRLPARGVAWLLGPAQALTLLLSWAAAARIERRRPGRGRGAAATSPGPGDEASQPAGDAVDSVVELGETTLEEILVPRSEVRALPEGASVGEWVELVAATRRTHLPVYGADLDEIRGYVCVKDLYRASSPEEPLARFVREARIVPESMRADDLLRELIAHKEKLAVVVDEFGGTAGLVRDHDLFEILLGEIEREGVAPGLRPLGMGVYLADGQLRIDDFNEASPVALPEGAYETLAGLFLARHGRIPRAGERLRLGGVTLEVIEATARRIVRLRVAIPAGGGALRAAAREGADGDR
ncbi:MAG: hypothetical protein FJY75_09365 [Candidatus Eisenbacteria bacterium]|uniref:CBS domain-containing protein n=1 Tax=Eiseniibacteriota bacterium TaxID=2212470 RepID=A0A938BR72_UNCEI|nr:hypothetical protein [Candidatus Eisenbacteria bacterium]